jgi:hypothetical protein
VLIWENCLPISPLTPKSAVSGELNHDETWPPLRLLTAAPQRAGTLVRFFHFGTTSQMACANLRFDKLSVWPETVEYWTAVPVQSSCARYSNDLGRFVGECLEREPGGAARKGFEDSGFVLQDGVNEIGRRLDFSVINGIYQARKGLTGYDGIWQDGNGVDLVMEVKTTDTYTISADQVERYRQDLIQRHAWTMRMIGASSLIRLLQVKVNAESSGVHSRRWHRRPYV